MDIVTLNKAHLSIIDNYNVALNRIAYEATNDNTAKSFLDMRGLLDTIVKYSNEFYKSVDEDGSMSEWMFMYPNMTYYAMAGFLLAKRTEYDEEYVKNLENELITDATSAIGELSDLLELFETELEKKILG